MLESSLFFATPPLKPPLLKPPPRETRELAGCFSAGGRVPARVRLRPPESGAESRNGPDNPKNGASSSGWYRNWGDTNTDTDTDTDESKNRYRR